MFGSKDKILNEIDGISLFRIGNFTSFEIIIINCSLKFIFIKLYYPDYIIKNYLLAVYQMLKSCLVLLYTLMILEN